MTSRTGWATGSEEFRGGEGSPVRSPSVEFSLACRVRLLVRGAGIGAWTAGLFLVWFLGALPLVWSDRLTRGWQTRVVCLWARGMCALLGIQRQVEGLAPRPPFFLVSNHLSYVDILVLAASVRGVFVSKSEVRRWPGIGVLATLFGTIFLDRTRTRDALRVLETFDRVVAAGVGVVVFPEGTSTAGEGVGPFHAALLEWAARREFPVHTVALRYETAPPDPPAHEAICWWGDMTFLPHVARLCTLRRSRATVRFAPEVIRRPDRRALADEARSAVLARFHPVVAPELL